jgi:hypothetical protein
MKLFQGPFIYTVLNKISPLRNNPKPGPLGPVTTHECFVRAKRKSRCRVKSPPHTCEKFSLIRRHPERLAVKLNTVYMFIVNEIQKCKNLIHIIDDHFGQGKD